MTCWVSRAESSIIGGEPPLPISSDLRSTYHISTTIRLLSLLLELTPPHMAALVAWLVKNLPVMQETWVQSLGLEDTLEKEMATHSSILAWRIPWTEKPSRLQSTGSQRVGHD